MAKKVDPKAKAKRQKIIAAIGGVILLGVLGFQVPRTLKMLHPADESASSSAPASTTVASATPIAAPSLSGGNASASPAAATSGGDGIADPDTIPAPASGQLLAFGLFRSKDPFIQQLDVGGPTGASGAVPSTGATGPAGSAAGQPDPSSPATPSSPSAPAALTTAEISVNGAPETVKVGDTFPTSDPFFKLVSLTKNGAKISISGGTLANGSPTVLLTKNKPLTLMNTSDGTRYVLRLLSVS